MKEIKKCPGCPTGKCNLAEQIATYRTDCNYPTPSEKASAHLAVARAAIYYIENPLEECSGIKEISSIAQCQIDLALRCNFPDIISKASELRSRLLLVDPTLT